MEGSGRKREGRKMGMREGEMERGEEREIHTRFKII